MATPRNKRGSSYTATTANSQTPSYETTTGNRQSTTNPDKPASNPQYTTYGCDTTTESPPYTGVRSAGRPQTARPRTGVSTLGVENQEIVCAISESRGVAPTVGLAFINLDTAEAVLSQFHDSQTYVKTVHKLMVFNPSNILTISSSANPKSKLFSIIEEHLEDLECNITLLDRKYWAEKTGLDYIQQLGFPEDVESIKTAVEGNYYAVCCFAAALKYAELAMMKTFHFHALRVKYEPSEGSMMIDLSTIRSLELVQNLHNPKSKDCLFGLLNATLTPMGVRLLRSNVLQPVTNQETLNKRYDAVEELSTKGETFFNVRAALKPFHDIDNILTQLILVPAHPSAGLDTEQSINNVIMLKHFVVLVKPIFESLAGSRSEMLQEIQRLCSPENVATVLGLINSSINEDTTFAQQPLDLRNQRTYAVKSGVNGLLDVARQTYKESTTDALQHITDMKEEHSLPLQTKYENGRQFYLRLRADDLAERNLPAIFINVYRRKDVIECQTLDLIKRNQKILDSHTEVLNMSDKSIKQLIIALREHMSGLFKICECIAMLDMLASFAHIVSSQGGLGEIYVRPVTSSTLAIRAGRHPIKERILSSSGAKYIPNDIYATQQTRFQIITGCNMSGKSTYIRSIALMTIMAQIGSFVPAQYAAFPIIRQLFARVSIDDDIEANVSTFAKEMREAAFILRNVDSEGSMVIMDELGRGTSTRDGLGIAIAIAEALVSSRALVWFATHFHDLARILEERSGVVNLHLAVNITSSATTISQSSDTSCISMLYTLAPGPSTLTHYGLAVAKILSLPPDVMSHAEHVSTTLSTLSAKKKSKGRESLSILKARRRKLLLNLKEHLIQAKEGNMKDEQLRTWLKDLQREFVMTMARLDAEVQEVLHEVAARVEDGEAEVVRQQQQQQQGNGSQSQQRARRERQPLSDITHIHTQISEHQQQRGNIMNRDVVEIDDDSDDEERNTEMEIDKENRPPAVVNGGAETNTGRNSQRGNSQTPHLTTTTAS